MKLSISADELDDLQALDDTALAKVVRDALRKFRGGRDTKPEGEDNELENANPGTPSHSGPSTGSLETPASRAGNQSANDTAQRLRELGLSPGRIREIMTPSSVSAADRAAAAEIVKGYNRL